MCNGESASGNEAQFSDAAWADELKAWIRFNGKEAIRSGDGLYGPAIAVIHSEADDIPHWIEAGRCYQRLALQTTALDLSTAFINQPVEVETLRPEFARAIGIGGRRPDLIVRIGHGPLMPRSLRRAIEEVTSE